MATHHASAGEVVDLKTWADDLPSEKSKVIVKTGEMELVRLVLPAGKDFADHKVAGAVVIHCIAGNIEVTAMGTTTSMQPGQLMHLLADVPHAVRASSDSVVLLTILFRS